MYARSCRHSPVERPAVRQCSEVRNTREQSSVTEDAISIGGVDLADPDTYLAGMPFDAFRSSAIRAVAWHPYKDGPGFLALTGRDKVFAVSRDSATWSSEATGCTSTCPAPTTSPTSGG